MEKTAKKDSEKIYNHVEEMLKVEKALHEKRKEKKAEKSAEEKNKG